MKKILASIFAALTCSFASSQISHALYYMESVPQTNILNPAHQPRAHLFIAVPGTNAHFGMSTNLSPLDFFQKDGDKWLTPLNNGFDYDKLYDAYGDKMAADADLSLNIISFGWRNKNGNFWTFSLSERVTADATLPTDLLKIGDKGLAEGTLLNLTDLGVNSMAYTELGVAYSRNVNEHWDYGFRIKFLAGSAAVRTKSNLFEIQTGREEWHVHTDYEVMTSAPLETENCLKEDGTVDFDSIDVRDFDETKDLVKYLMPRLKNPGFGIDLGINYKLNNNFSFSASITDLGMISWGRDVNRFKTKGDFDFDGIDYKLDNKDHKDDFQNAIDDTVDSLLAECNVTLEDGRFTTRLYPSVYVGAVYTPTYFLNVGFLSHTRFLATDRIDQIFSVSATFNPYKFPGSLVGGYNIDIHGNSSAMAGFSLRFAVLQFYAMAGYAPAKYNVYKTKQGDDIPVPHNISNLEVSVGLNFVFGSKGYKDRPMINSNSLID